MQLFVKNQSNLSYNARHENLVSGIHVTIKGAKCQIIKPPSYLSYICYVCREQSFGTDVRYWRSNMYSIWYQELLLRHSPVTVPVLMLYRASRELSNGSFSTAAIMAYSLAGVYSP